jgi:hypothetical protein
MTVSIEIPEVEPLQVIVGNTWTWKKSLSDYLPSNEWQLTYALVKSDALIEITATDSDDDHLVEVAAATTADYDAGVYDYQATVSKYDDLDADEPALLERYTIKTGKIEVLPAFSAQATGYDNRSHVKATLDALEAVILGKASKDQLSYSIAGRSLSRMSPQELLDWRKAYRAEYASEERKAGRKSSNLIRVRFE